MKALRKLGKGAESVQLCEVEKPIPGPNDLLVKVMAAGICGTDLHILAEEYSHSVPVTLGHEYTGVVEQVGSGVTDFQVGDQVISVSIAYPAERVTIAARAIRFTAHRRPLSVSMWMAPWRNIW